MPIAGIASMFFVYRLATMVKISSPWAPAILAFIPLIGPIQLIFIDREVTAALKSLSCKANHDSATEESGRVNNRSLMRPFWASIPCCLSLLLFIFSNSNLNDIKLAGSIAYSQGLQYQSSRDAAALGAFAGALFGDQTGFKKIEEADRQVKSTLNQIQESIDFFSALKSFSRIIFLFFAMLWFGPKIIERLRV